MHTRNMQIFACLANKVQFFIRPSAEWGHSVEGLIWMLFYQSLTKRTNFTLHSEHSCHSHNVPVHKLKRHFECKSQGWEFSIHLEVLRPNLQHTFPHVVLQHHRLDVMTGNSSWYVWLKSARAQSAYPEGRHLDSARLSVLPFELRPLTLLRGFLLMELFSPCWGFNRASCRRTVTVQGSPSGACSLHGI